MNTFSYYNVSNRYLINLSFIKTHLVFRKIMMENTVNKYTENHFNSHLLGV